MKKICADLSSGLGGGLSAVLVYGSALGADYLHGRSNINLLLVIDDTGYENLKSVRALCSPYRKHGIIAPLVLSPDHIETSRDVFSMEFLNITEQYAVVMGEDPFKGMSIDDSLLRLECEQQLKGNLIRIREVYLEGRGTAADLKGLISGSVSSYVSLMKNLIRLKKTPVPPDAASVIETASGLYAIKASPFKEALALKTGKGNPSFSELEGIFSSYLKEAAALAAAVDKLLPGGRKN